MKLAPIFAIGAILAVDAATKAAVLRGMAVGETIDLIPGLFSLTHVRNRGAAFGMLADLPDPWRQVFFVGIALVTVVLLIAIYRGTPPSRRLERGAIVAIVAGAIGNVIDRFVYGEVVDFLDFYIADWHWPAFNVADSCITVGVVVLVLTSFSDVGFLRGRGAAGEDRSDSGA